MTLPADLRDALRSLARHRTFAAVAILTLAIGIGANTALFSVVHAVLLRPLPYPDPSGLVWITTSVPALRAEIAGGPDYLDWRDQARSLESIAAWDEAPNLTRLDPNEPEQLAGARVSASLLPTLGAAVARGRGFETADEKLNAAPVAIVSDRLWRRLHGADTAPAGQMLRLDGGTYSIVGVLPRDFVFPETPEVDVLLPLRLDEARERGRQMMSIVRIIGRVRPGTTIGQTQLELSAIRDRAERDAAARSQPPPPGGEFDVFTGPPGGSGPSAGPAPGGARHSPPAPGGSPDAGAMGRTPGAPAPRDAQAPVPVPGGQPVPPPGGGQMQITYDTPGPGGPGGPGRPRPGLPESTVVVRPLHAQLVGDVRPALLMLAATVGLVLLVACANVANLVLARTTGRTRELAVRAALGAGRWRIVRQLLTESLVLSAAGGVAGLLLAQWALRALVAALPPALSQGWLGHAGIRIDAPVLTFALVVAALTGALAGIAPALLSSRTDLHASLKDAAPAASSSPARRRLRSALVAAEIAMAVVLLASAGLLVRSFARVLSVDPGFRPERVVTMALDVGRGPDDASRRRTAAFFADLAERTRALPGVEAVAYGDTVPLREYSIMLMGLETDAGQARGDGPPPEVAITVVSPGYFRTFGMRLLGGRTFGDADRSGAAPVAIVNERMARQFWGAADVVGRRIRIGPRHPEWITIVGVVADVKHDGPASATRSAMYRPFDQDPMSAGFLAVRSAADAGAVVQAVRREVHRRDASLVVHDVATMDERMAGAVVGRRFSMLLVGAFAAVALLLAAIGLYGVLSSAIAERTREIGIRMALGAHARDVVGLVLAQSSRMVAAGLALGMAGAAAVGPLLASALFDVSVHDPITFAAVPVALALVSLIAAWLPARRATRVDPLEALRQE